MNLMTNPLISVVMSVYNDRAFVGSAIRSILKQTCRDFEFLITDDGSTDGSASVIDEFAHRDDRIKVFHQANTGLTVALNRMIAESRGEYIARMDADDLSHPLRFEKQCKYLLENPACGMVGTGSLNIDDQDRVIAGYVLPDDHDLLVRRLERGRNDIKHGSIMANRKVLMVLNGPYRFRYGQDFDLYLRLSQKTKLGMIQHVLFLYRVHSNAIQGAVGPFREKQNALMLELYQARQLGLKEPTWEDRDKTIFPPTMDLSKGNQTDSLFIRGVMSFEAGSMAETRRYLRGTCRHHGYRARSMAYMMLSMLPMGFGRQIKNKVDFLRDELRDYRVPKEDWKDILMACKQGG
jgi:glycosyltransferase involved in cell wall biosynthesis